jgi:hypothetical protein
LKIKIERIHRLKDGMSSPAPQAIKENSLELFQMTELTSACAPRPDTSEQYGQEGASFV